MRPHRIEIAVIVQQRMAVLDAKRANDQVNGLADRDALSPQGTIIVCRLDRDFRVEHPDNIEVVQLAGDPLSMSLVPCALQDLKQHNIADQECRLAEQ